MTASRTAWTVTSPLRPTRSTCTSQQFMAAPSVRGEITSGMPNCGICSTIFMGPKDLGSLSTWRTLLASAMTSYRLWPPSSGARVEVSRAMSSSVKG